MNSKITRHLHESRSSGTSRKTRPSKSSKDREIKEKVEVAELMAEAELLLQRYIIENEAGKLKIKKNYPSLGQKFKITTTLTLKMG